MLLQDPTEGLSSPGSATFISPARTYQIHHEFDAIIEREREREREREQISRVSAGCDDRRVPGTG